jgi:hypothetical protein
VTNTIQDLVLQLQSKGYGAGRPITESSLRRDYSLPDWVGVPPAFVTLVNEHLETITVGPEQPDPRQNDTQSSQDAPPAGQKASPDDSGPDIFDLFVGVLGGFSDRK